MYDVTSNIWIIPMIHMCDKNPDTLTSTTDDVYISMDGCSVPSEVTEAAAMVHRPMLEDGSLDDRMGIQFDKPSQCHWTMGGKE